MDCDRYIPDWTSPAYRALRIRYIPTKPLSKRQRPKRGIPSNMHYGTILGAYNPRTTASPRLSANNSTRALIPRRVLTICRARVSAVRSALGYTRR